MSDAIQINAAATAKSAQSRLASPARDDRAGEDGGFSYAMAAASLERQASQSLKTHGATPNGASSASAEPSQGAAKTGQSPTQASARPAPGDAGAAHAPNGATRTPVKSAPAAAPANSQNTPAAATPMTANTASTTAQPAAQAGALIAKPAPATAAAAREQIAARPATPKTETAKAAAPAQTRAAQDFAQILARRLEKSSQFEFRLDPPEMGRVEGRLTLGDDGKAVLALKFDNQAAFDMFARDEQALRQTLANAGFEFADGDFVFSFRDDAAPEPALANIEPEKTVSLAAPSYDAAFAAPWSAGALDIRI